MELTESSKNNGYANYKITLKNRYDPKIQLYKTKDLVSVFLINKLKKLNGIKINVSLDITFEK